ncbi:hypothetical protein BKA63DRAFT_566158 [Paraphoma chrysanthemicola]|nr:hypothetical protein BKA63DRAFT_566158 [Paraphoma chrysanthemicola]
MDRKLISDLETLLGRKKGRRKPKEFMDLPPEIRLMIYKYLGPTKKRSVVPLKTRGHVILINMSVAVGILATCRKINQEASPILNPILKKLAQEPPRIVIKGHLLADIVHLPYFGSTRIYLLDEIIAQHKTLPEAIARYRKGLVSIEHLRKLMNVQKYVTSEAHDAIKGLATFLLRTARYDEQFQQDYPGRASTLRITVDITDLHKIQKLRVTQWPLTRYLRTIFYQPNPHGRYVHADIYWVLQWFITHAAMRYDRQQDWRFCVSWRYAPEGKVEEPPMFTERFFSTAVTRGLINHRLKDPDTIFHGGVCEDEDEN